jgi:hypothetical protein
MKLTLKQLVNGSEALNRLGGKGVKELTQKVFYNLSKNIGLIQPELVVYEKTRMSLIDKYSIETKTKDGDVYGIPPKNLSAFNAEIEVIQSTELDLSILPCTLTDEIIEKAGITAIDLYLLDWMFILPDEK